MQNIQGGTGCVRGGDEENRRECNMDKFRTLLTDSRENTIAILGDRWWPQTAKQERDKTLM